MKFSIKETAGLVTFTEEILNGKLHFLCSVIRSTGLLYRSNIVSYVGEPAEPEGIRGLVDFRNC